MSSREDYFAGVIYMGILTERERGIMKMLKAGKPVREISKHFGVSITSISRSISNIRTKALDLEDDIGFLMEIGFMKVKAGGFHFITRNKDPKALGKLKQKIG